MQWVRAVAVSWQGSANHDKSKALLNLRPGVAWKQAARYSVLAGEAATWSLPFGAILAAVFQEHFI